MHVLPARAKKVEKDNGNKTFKEKREAQKKANAEAEHTWNTLFMRVCACGHAQSFGRVA